MKRFVPILAALLSLAACVPAPSPRTLGAGPARCRVGPDGGAPVVDRGIGGTGGPTSQRADRGIGGTGGPVVRTADRGIGGTGITGIVSGFASVCVDGLEVALSDRVAVDIDGSPDIQAALRVGQMVAITAGPWGMAPDVAPVASGVSVRHEVSGPVEAVLRADPGLIVVAGQRVRVPGKTAGSMIIQPGVWVAVSGLRGPDGDIIASRLDQRAPGRVIVHGPLIVADGEATIGSLTIRAAGDLSREAGTYVTASGTWQDGALDVANLVPDLLVSNPPKYFGPETTHLVLESYGRFEASSAAVTGEFRAGLSAGFAPPADLTGPVVMSLERQPDGSFTVFHAGPVPAQGVPAVTPGNGPDTSRPAPGSGDAMRMNGASGSTGTAPPASTAYAAQSAGQMAGSNTTAAGFGPRPSDQQTMRYTAQTGGPTQPGSGITLYGAAESGGATQALSTSRAGFPRGSVMNGAGARAGGIRLMGVGIAGHFGHGAGAIVTPHSIGLHLHLMKLWR